MKQSQRNNRSRGESHPALGARKPNFVSFILFLHYFNWQYLLHNLRVSNFPKNGEPVSTFALLFSFFFFFYDLFTGILYFLDAGSNNLFSAKSVLTCGPEFTSSVRSCSIYGLHHHPGSHNLPCLGHTHKEGVSSWAVGIWRARSYSSLLLLC